MMVSMWAFLAWVFFTLVLAWRVWRLEDKVRFYSDHYRKRCDLNAEASRNNPTRLHMDIRFDDHRRVMEGLSRNLTSLARALGYEWKRTEAKEGWERKIGPFSIADMDAYRRAVAAYVSPAPPLDRRKGERRKPSAKKPRRATH